MVLFKKQSDISDEDLAQIVLKDSERYGDLIDRYEKKLRGYIRRISGFEDETIDEILQMVFIKAYKNLAWFDQSLRFSSWIYRIAHNEAVDTSRKRKHQVLSLESSDDDMSALVERLSSDIDVLSDVRSSEMLSAMQDIFTNLSDNHRQILTLHYLEDKSYEEISDILKRPMWTVATLISRAKQQFRALAEEEQFSHLFTAYDPS